MQLARKQLGIYPTRLSDVCRHLKIELNHHEALSDARMSAARLPEKSDRTAAELSEARDVFRQAKNRERQLRKLVVE